MLVKSRANSSWRVPHVIASDEAKRASKQQGQHAKSIIAFRFLQAKFQNSPARKKSLHVENVPDLQAAGPKHHRKSHGTTIKTSL